jgi:hypothetical protein
MATVTPIQTSTENTKTSQQCLQSPIDQASHQMDARHLWLPFKIELAQSHQGGQVCVLVYAD